MAINATYVNGFTFTISGSNETDEFHAGRRVQANCGTDGYKYGTISGSSFAVDTTVVIYPDPGDDLTNKLTTVKYGIVSAEDSSLPVHDHLTDNGEGGQLTEASISDLDKYTQAEVTTISGNIVSQIPTDYYTTGEVDTISGSLQAQIDTVSGTGISEVSEDTTPELGGNLDFLTYTISGTGTIITGDHGTATHPEVVNVIYGTTSPTINGVPEGTLYIEYEA